VRDDGSKAPDVSSWTVFQTTRPAVEQMAAWAFGTRAGYGVVSGAVSHTESWDFDCADTFDAFIQAAHATGLGAVVDRIRAGYEDATPNGGRRWIVAYPDTVTWQDCTLARRPGRDGEPKIKTLIELPTFAIMAPSNGCTHPSGKPYVRVSGDFATIADYTTDERAALLELARSFDEMPRREYAPQTPKAAHRSADTSDRKPGEDFNARMSWPELLEPAGWTRVYDRGDVTCWRRPGKAHGISATTNHAGSDLFFPFTSSSEFQPDTSYSKFGVYATLHCGGDFHAASAALAAHGYGATHTRRAAYQEKVSRATQQAPPMFAKRAVTGGAGQCVLQPLLLRPFSGWFARGAVHLAAGSSGAGKTTLILDLLRTQARGGRYLGHASGQLDFLVLFADRGAVSNAETLARMRIDPHTIPIDHLPPTANGEEAVRAILTAIERQPELPAVVFVEGADLLVEDPNKSPIVTAFVVGLRQIAEHYAIAIVLSVGSPKARPHEQYALKRDQVYGSQAWSRLANTVLVLSVTGDGTVATRDLVVLHRNAAAETFHLAFVDGLLVETETSQATEPNMIEWMRDAETFTQRQFRTAFALSGTRAGAVLDGFVAAGTLRAKEKNDRTLYIYRRPLPQQKTGQSHSERDKNERGEERADPCPENSGTGHENGDVSPQNTECFDVSVSDPLVPPKPRPLSHSKERNEGQRDVSRFFRGIRAREDVGVERLPGWVTEREPPLHAADPDAPFADHDDEPAPSRNPWRHTPLPPSSVAAAAAVAADRLAPRTQRRRR
jgi:hypothetical protein